MFLQHFDYFHYHSNHNFHVTSKKMIFIISTFPPVHIPSFIKLPCLSLDPDFSGQMDGQTDRWTYRWRANL